MLLNPKTKVVNPLLVATSSRYPVADVSPVHVAVNDVEERLVALFDTEAGGTTGCTLITILAEDGEVHADALVTVKLYVPAVRPVITVVVPVPVVVTAPGVRVKVQIPVDGKPDNETLPVATLHVVCVIELTTGAGHITVCEIVT